MEKKRSEGDELSSVVLFPFDCGWTESLVQTPREVLFLSFNP